MKEWYEIENAGEVDSPALLVYRDRVLENIALAKETGGSDLRPHVKTHKMAGITKLMLQAGIDRFKCATIAEAEMLAEAGAKDILLAYQPTAVKAPRFLGLARSYPGTRFACLVDNPGTARMLSELLGRQASGAGRENVEVYIDLNVGMDRTGVKPAGAASLYRECLGLENLRVAGLHAYDGHIHNTDPGVRAQRAGQVFETAESVRVALEQADKQTDGQATGRANGQANGIENGRAGEKLLGLVIGGSPTFPFHARREGVETSPGTFVFWDEGYRRMLPEQDFRYAALLLTRIISRIDERTLCLDLGYKSVASENPLDRRVVFPGHPGTEILGHSEEHLVVRVPEGGRHEIGDCWYGVPYHVCPTVALYEAAHVVTGSKFTEKWEVTARDRQITI